MKQLNFTLLLIVLMCMVGAKAFAHSIEVTNADGVSIYYDFNGLRELEVTYCYKDNSYYDDYGNWVEDYEERPYSGNVAIPSTVTYYGTTYTVTSIGENAFSNCSGLTSVTIPKSVTRIGDYSFYNCSGLTSVIIPSGVTNIGYEAFGYDEFIGGSLALVTVKMETPAEIYDSTFPDRTNQTLYVPKGCKAAYETADYWKEFKEIIEMSNIDFADAKVKAICVSRWDTNGDGELSEFEAAQVWNLSSAIFTDNKNITSFDELQYFTELRSIGYSAFSGCSGLKSVTIPSGVTSIGSDAFSGCSSLTSVTIPSGVTSIGSDAFSGCSSLTSVNIPFGVTSIGSSAFQDCKRLKEVNYDATNCTKMGSDYSLVFEGCSSFTTLRIGENVQTIPSYAFYNCTGLTSVNIGSSVTSIGSYAFYNCTGLTSVNIGSSVTSIGSSAFYNCTGLTSVKIYDLAAWCKISFGNASNNPLYYAHHLFLNGEEITDLAIPSNVEKIENNAFSYCTGLTSLSIPSSVTNIGFGYYGDNAFYGCSNLATITVDENNSKYDSRDGSNAIIEKESSKLIYGCKNTVIPSSVTSIDKYAFKGCSALSSIYIPGSIKTLSFNFGGCTSLTSITVGEGAEEIAASGLSGLKKVTITLPNSLTKIGSQAFSSCSGCTVTIGTGIQQLNDAFYNTSDMTIYIHAFKRPQTSYHCFYMSRNCKSYVPYGRGQAYESGSSLEGGSYWCSVSEMPYPALTIGSSGYATYCSDKALDFSEVEDVKAYIATDYQVSTNTLLLTRAKIIPAGEGIIVVGNPGTYDIPECTTDFSNTNLLNGMILPSYVEPTAENYTNLLLSVSNTEVSFQPMTESTPCFAGTAYLHLPSDCLPVDAQIVNVRLQEMECTDISQMDNVIYIEPTEARCSSQTTLSVKMKNNVAIQTIQFDLYLPDGITIVPNEDNELVTASKERINKFSYFQSSMQSDGALRLLAQATSTNVPAGDGEICRIVVDIPESMQEGEYPLIIKKALMVEKNNTSHSPNPDLVQTKLTLLRYVPGDASGDGEVNAIDFNMIGNHILGQTQSGLNVKAADISGDGEVNAIDFNMVGNMILNGGGAAARMARTEEEKDPA